MIRAEKLSLKVGDKSILKDINFRAKRGHITGVIGRNGAGKSTLIKALSGLIDVEEGHIFFNDKNLQDLDQRELALKRSVLSQEVPVSFGLSVLDILLMGRYPHSKELGLSKKDYEILDQVVKDLDLERLLKTPYPSLSGGERQKIQFGRSLCQLMPLENNTEKVFILDEPLSALDLCVQQELLTYIQKYVREFGLTVIVILHDLNWISQICDHVYLIEKGEMACEGTPEEVFTEEKLKRFFNVRTRVLKSDEHKPTMIFY